MRKSFSLSSLNLFPSKSGKIWSGDEQSNVGKAAGLAGRGIKGVISAPVRVAEGEGIIGGRIIPEPIKNFIRFIFKFLFGLVIILIFALLLIMLYNYFASGIGGSEVTSAQAGVEQTGLPIIAKLGLTNAYNAIFNPEKLTTDAGFNSDIKKYENDEDLGVKLVSMKQLGRPYYKEPIEVDATFSAKSNENTKLVVFCKLGDEELIPAIVSASQSSESKSNEINILKETPYAEQIAARCLFKNGIDPEKTTRIQADTSGTVLTPTLNKEIPIVSSEIVRIFVAFDFTQKASHNTYFMHAKELSSLLKIKQDPFKYFKVNDPQLGSDRKVTSIATSGPLNLGIGTDVSQPFVENVPYSFGITLSNNLGWRGNLKKLNSLKVHIPPFLALEGDTDFGSNDFASTCAFDNLGELDTDGYKVYTIKDSYLERINKECDKLTLQQLSISEQQCIDLFGKEKDLTFRCSFKIKDFPWDEGMRNDYIWAESSYVYEFQNSVAANAYKRPATIA